MTNIIFLFYMLIVLLNFQGSSAFSLGEFFSWDVANSKPEESKEVKQSYSLREGVSLVSIPYEELSLEDKFLLEAEKFSSISLSTLDTCEHRVILKLKAACSHLSEEELAKLSIKLLNCQAEISGREQVVCTDEMTLKECTSPMNSETWNAYHVINNRARAVCYALRQQQFQALSEMTVNKVMSTSLHQLQTMDELEGRQKELTQLTLETVTAVLENQLALKDRESGLKLSHEKLRSDIADNLRQVNIEKAMIHMTHSQLHTLSRSLTNQLESMGSQMSSKNQEHNVAHGKLLSNLVEMTKQTEKMWAALDEKSRSLEKNQEIIYKSTAEVIEKLKIINESLNYLVIMANNVKTDVDKTILWANSLVGGDSVILLAVAKNVTFLVFGVILSLFLQLTIVYRLLLLMSVLTNIIFVYKHRPLDFLKLSTIILGLWLVYFLICVSWPLIKKWKRSRPKENVSASKKKIENDSEDSNFSKYNFANHKNGSLYNLKEDERESSSRESSIASSIRQRAPSVESKSGSLCAATCRNGQLCRSTPARGHKFCRRHIAH